MKMLLYLQYYYILKSYYFILLIASVSNRYHMRYITCTPDAVRPFATVQKPCERWHRYIYQCATLWCPSLSTDPSLYSCRIRMVSLGLVVHSASCLQQIVHKTRTSPKMVIDIIGHIFEGQACTIEIRGKDLVPLEILLF